LPEWPLPAVFRHGARGLTVLWALFWTWFGLASGFAEQLPGSAIAAHAALPGLLFLLLAVIAWRWEFTGGVLLIIAGLNLVVYYPLAFGDRFPQTMVVATTLMLAVPPIVGGLMFLGSWGSKR
jgi:hypothetical protein